MSLDPRTPVSDIERMSYEIRELKDRIETLAAPSGTMAYRAVEKLTLLVADIQNQLDDYIANGTYNKAQIDAKIASPGNISPGNVTASGTVSANYGGDFPAGLRSTGAYNTNVTGGGAYVACWIHNDGRVGFAPSSRRFKTNIKAPEFTLDDVLKLQGFFFEYWAAPPYAQESQRRNFGPMAEDAHDAGFDFLVDYDDEGKPFGIRPDALAAVAFEGLRLLVAEVRGNAPNRK